jgi:hypothetical protein
MFPSFPPFPFDEFFTEEQRTAYRAAELRWVAYRAKRRAKSAAEISEEVWNTLNWWLGLIVDESDRPKVREELFDRRSLKELVACDAEDLRRDAEEAAEQARVQDKAADEAWAVLSPTQREIAEYHLLRLLSFLGPGSSRYRALLTVALPKRRTKFENGDRTALPEAITLCAAADVPLPDWLAEGFLDANSAVAGFRAASWNQVLGWPHPKRLHRERARWRKEVRTSVWLQVMRLHLGGRLPLDDQLFEAAAKKITEEFRPKFGPRFRVRKTLCRELFYEFNAHGKHSS